MIVVAGNTVVISGKDLTAIKNAALLIGDHRRRAGLDDKAYRDIADGCDAAMMSLQRPEEHGSQARFVSTSEAAEHWQCSRRHAQRLAKRKGAKKIGRDYMIQEGDL